MQLISTIYCILLHNFSRWCGHSQIVIINLVFLESPTEKFVDNKSEFQQRDSTIPKTNAQAQSTATLLKILRP